MDSRAIIADLRQAAAATARERSPEKLLDALARGAWVYGAGGYGRIVRDAMAARGIPVRGVIDQRAGAPGFPEQPVGAVTPDAFDRADATGATLVVAMHNFAADQAPVVRWARAAGFAEVVIPAELPDLLGPTTASYWLTGREHAAGHFNAIERLLGMLADPASVAVVAALARFRLTGDIAAHPASRLADQYFPADLPWPDVPLRMVDGGAYTGDTYPVARAAAAGRFAEWIAFEPDPANFARLAVAARAADVDRAILYPCGLGAVTGQLRFAAGGEAGSRAAAGGDSVVQVVALDEVLAGARPNFVKLDIEGAEADALDGMAGTLERDRPRLAMSVYHRPADLWELPFKVAEMLPGARLHVRQHGFNGFDTVLYALP